MPVHKFIPDGFADLICAPPPPIAAEVRWARGKLGPAHVMVLSCEHGMTVQVADPDEFNDRKPRVYVYLSRGEARELVVRLHEAPQPW